MVRVSPLKLQKYLQKIEYPVNKEQLITHAKQQGADSKVQEALSKLEDKTYLTAAEISQTLTAQ